MQVSGIGSGGAGMGASAPAAGAAPAAQSTGATPSTAADASSLASTLKVNGQFLPNGIEGLIELLDGFKTAEILLALMFLSSSRDDEEQQGGGSSAAMGFLAGLALAGGLSQQVSIEWQSPAAATPPESVAPTSLNVQV